MRWECEEISEHYLDDMPTSIVQIYTQEGFVVAADGREYDIKNGKTLADNVRKIFSVKERRRLLLYAMSGTNKLTSHGGTKDDLDVVSLIHESVSKPANSRRRSLWHYASALSDGVDLPEHEEDDEPTVIYLDGYYDARPKHAKITIYHNGEKSPQISAHDPFLGKLKGCGSGVVLEALRRDSEATANYRTRSWKLEESERTLADAIDLAKSYIGAQCDDEVRKMDSKWYNAIGGIGHLCVLKPSGDVEWMFRNPETREWISCDPPTGPTIP